MVYQTLRLEREGPLALITLHRPQADNGVDSEMAAELAAVCPALNQDDRVRVVLLTGAGAAFSAGPFPPPELLEGGASPAELSQRLQNLRGAAAVASVEKPFIAAINGPALGMGMELALACDLRLASPLGRFSLPHLAHGLLPWDGGTQRLPRITGRAWALDMLLTGREVDAREALSMGLVHQVVPHGELLAKARELGGRIASYGPIAARYAKETVWQGMDMALEQGLRLEADLNILLQTTVDRAEGIRSFLERREPKYRGE
ncbi:MAG: enoyl-CoA hydratase/isomerase family protein [Chloroflexi bacterium]|nr:enoyl-CoA hydratase/isomerase family protein [Chloroflexota bacterium]